MRPYYLPAGPLAEVLRAWAEAGAQPHSELEPNLARRYSELVSGRQRRVELGVADRLLVAIGSPELLPTLYPHRREGRAGYHWPNPHPLRRITREQVKHLHVLHDRGGLSINALAARLWEELGYASQGSAREGIRSAFKRDGLKVRDRVEATIAAHLTHGQRARGSAAYKRWHRARVRAGLAEPWPSDDRSRYPRRRAAA